ncbi:methionine--tRNA ligase, partial [Candidatus Dependentiae bacterium]|nr:methionine--tRNA ligase [Candidatus Dependentiae bacterium]
MTQKHFYITTPIYYVNAKPHLGNLYSTLIADAIARWHKVLGESVFFLTGTDEHGQKVQEKAQQEGKDPQTFVDSMIPPFKEMWAKYNIEFDKFIRTTDVAHKEAVAYWIKKLMTQGDIYKATYEGWYCVPCETFVNIGADPAKDVDGALICPSCSRALKELAEESYFFKLSAYQDRLLEFYAQHPDFITPKERLQEVLAFVKSGLRDLCLSRKTVKWGISFPGDPSHTVYVWGDALNNYISAVGYGVPGEEQAFATWWPAAMHVMAKDIVRFHAVYWPAFLMAADIALPKKLLVHGYILVDNQKMSKSKGNAIDPAELADAYGIDQVRYYLLRQMPITQDGSFSFQDLTEHINADLANSLGNLLNRSISLASKFDLSIVTSADNWLPQAEQLRLKCIDVFHAYKTNMDNGMLHIALAEVWRLIGEVNAYFHATEPWKVAVTDKALFEQIISATCHSLRAIGLMLWPIMPKKMDVLLHAIGMPLFLGLDHEEELCNQYWNKTFTLTSSGPLFTRIEPMDQPVQPVVAPQVV